MVEPTQRIQETFADQCESIDQLCEKDPDSRSLCCDFDDCVDAFRHWIASDDPGADAKAREERDLIEVLHAEIRQFLHPIK